MARHRRMPIGAEVLPEGGVHFRVWAPRRRAVEVVLEGGPGATPRGAAVALEPEGGGYFAGEVAAAAEGTLYRFRLDGEGPFPDPASRFQPGGPHGPSRVVDPNRFAWTDRGWRGVSLHGLVVYEMHIGTFTPEGTWAAAAEQLPALADLGVGAVELMPVADFPGRFGWGYDGVNLFAPYRVYGEPDDARRFVDRAHALGIGVLLDVVYNHFGPDGNYLPEFSDSYLTKRHATEWGDGINFDGTGSGPVREYFLANAGFWIDEYHMDGLRLDATQSIQDTSAEHILTATAQWVRKTGAARGAATVVIGENEPQQAVMIRPEGQGGHGLDALWNDDFHHSALVALTGRREAYFTDHRGAPQEFISAAKYGWLFQGQRYARQQKRRGTPSFGLEPARFVNFLENHDQVANNFAGRRTHQVSSPAQHRAVTALLLLLPGTPMLFQGQEFNASSPFFYFLDSEPELAEVVRVGRADFLAQFRSRVRPEMRARMAAPDDPETFARSKLDPSERASHTEAVALHRDLIRLRRADPVFSAQRPGGLDGAVLGPGAFVLRYFGDGGDDRIVAVNLGDDLHLEAAPEPLLAPPVGRRWRPIWSSEDPRYGGSGQPAVETPRGWDLAGHAAVVLAARTPEEPPHGP